MGDSPKRGCRRASRYVAPYFIIISGAYVRNARTFLPLTPFLFLLASTFVTVVIRRIRDPHGNPSTTQTVFLIIMVIVVITALTPPLVRTIRHNLQLVMTDSRETARVWIAHNLPTGARIAVEGYAPYVDPQRFSVQGFVRMIDQPPQWYVANRFDYLIFGEDMFMRFYREPDKYSSEISQYETLFQSFEPVRIFTDGGYEVRIYHVKDQ